MLASLGLFCAAGFAWAILGRIPVTVEGFGVLINPGNVKGIQSTGGGQITTILVREGQKVTSGEVIAMLNQPELRQQLEQEKQKREQLLSYNESEEVLDEERRALELASFEQQRTFINEEISKLDDLTTRLRDQNATFNKEQRKIA